MTKEELKNRVLNGGRGSGQSLRLLCEVYENRIAELERKLEQTEKDLADYQFNYPKIKQLGERCNQLLKDKGSLTDELQELKETFAQTIENDEVAYETLKLHDQEEIGMLNSKIAGLEQQIEKMKLCQNCKSENNDYMEKPCCECSRCLGDIKRKGTSDKWEIKENE